MFKSNGVMEYWIYGLLDVIMPDLGGDDVWALLQQSNAPLLLFKLHADFTKFLIFCKKMQKMSDNTITDESGKKTSVILPLNEFIELVEDIEDLAVVAERREEPTISHEELIKEFDIR